MLLILSIIALNSADVYRPFDLREIAVTEKSIFVAVSEHSRILRYDLEGRFLNSFGRQGQAPGEFNLVALSGLSQGHVLAVSMLSRKHVSEFTPDGRLHRSILIPQFLSGTWPYRIEDGWFTIRTLDGRTLLESHDLAFKRSLKVALHEGPSTDLPLERRRFSWALSRSTKYLFYLPPSSMKLFIYRFADKQSRTVNLGGLKAEGVTLKPLLTHPNHPLLLKEMLPGPGENAVLHWVFSQDRSRSIFVAIQANGTQSTTDFTMSAYSRLIRIEGESAWVTTYDEDIGAGIKRILLNQINAFLEEHPIHFSEIDQFEYNKTLRKP